MQPETLNRSIQPTPTVHPRGFTPEDDLIVSAFLQDQRRCLDRLTLPARYGLGNPRIAVHAASDPELERFRQTLFPADWSHSREFEQAVGILLHFFGFQTDPLSSQSGASAAVDHVAHDPLSDAVIGVECTVGPLETGKLGKLVARTQALRELVHDATIFPVLVCARPRAELSTTELEKAATDGVVVLARKDLQNSWIAVERGATTNDFIRDLQRRLAEVALGCAVKAGGQAEPVNDNGTLYGIN